MDRVPMPDSLLHRPSDEYLRDMLERIGLSQRAAARLLGVNERTMRYYCSGEQPMPYTVQYAVEMLVFNATGRSQRTLPMAEDAGTLSEARPVVDVKCRACAAQTVSEQQWDSHCGGFEDHKYTCASCAHVWWIDGIDS